MGFNMSLVSSASQKAHWEKTAYPVQRKHYHRSVLSAWLLGVPLAALLGTGANYLWHKINNKPVLEKVEIRKQTELPYKQQSAEVIYATTPLPVSPPQSEDPLTSDDIAQNTLQQRFTEAAAAVGSSSQKNSARHEVEVNQDDDVSTSIPDALKAQLPMMKYNAHIYSSNPEDCVINLNGRDYHEGDEVYPGLVLEKIISDASIFSFEHQKFSISALMDW